MPTGTLTYRLVVEDPTGIPHTPGDATDAIDGAHFVVTSERDANCPYICEPPHGDGEGHVPLTGKAEDGSYVVPVADADLTTGAVIAGEDFDSYNTYVPGGPSWTTNWSAVAPAAGAGGGMDPVNGFGGTQCWSTSQMLGFDFDPPNPIPWGTNKALAQRTWGVSHGLAPDTTYRVRFKMDLSDSGHGSIGAYPYPHTITCGIEAGDGARMLVAVVEPTDGGSNAPRDDPGIPGDVTVYTYYSETTGSANVGDSIPELAGWVTYDFLTTTDSSGDLTLIIGVFDRRNFSGYARIDDIEILEAGCGGTGRVVTRQLGDANARHRMLGRRAWLELSFDLGATYTEVVKFGHWLGATLINGIQWDITIGDTRRVERRTPMFAEVTPNFPLVTPLLGGPVYGGFPPFFANYGLPTFRVTNVVPEDIQPPGIVWQRGFVTLRYVRGPLPPTYSPTQSSFTTAARDYINKRARPFAVHAGPLQVGNLLNLAAPPYEFPRIVVALEDAGDGLPTITDYTPVGGTSPAPIPFPAAIPGATIPNDELISSTGEITVLWSAEQPTVGDEFLLHVYPKDISADNPLHWFGHVIDLHAGRFEDLGIAYDVTSRDAVKNAVGPEQYVLLRWTNPGELCQAFFERLQATFGYGVREGRDGEREFFTTRVKNPGSPAVTITDDDLTDAGDPPWEHQEQSLCNTLRITTHRLSRWATTDGDPRPADDLLSVESTVVVDFSVDGGATKESDTYGLAEQRYELPGMMLVGSQGQPVDVQSFARTVGNDTFNRYGRGAPHRTLPVRRSVADAVSLGDEITVDVGHLPTLVAGRTPVAQRGGSHELMVVRRTETPGGPTLVLVDASNGVSASIIPELAIVEDTDAYPGGGFVRITVTNGDDIVVASYGMRIEYGLGVSEPTAGTVLFTDTPLEFILRASAYAYQAGPYPAGETVWVRGQAWLPGGGVSAWGAWVSVTLAGLATPDDLASVDTSPTSELLTWTNTDSTKWIDVQLKLSSAASYTQIIHLPPGSDRYEFTGLLPSTSYDARIRYVDLSPLFTGGPYASLTFTTDDGASTLLAPINPIAYRGLDRSSAGLPVQIDGRCGLIVTAQSVPSDLVFEVAVETAVGSATPGSYSEFARVPANPPFTTTQAGLFAPSDGKLRYFRAKSVRPGWTDSPYSSPIVSIDPWGSTTTTPGTNGSAGTPPAPVLSFTIDGSGNVTVYASVGATVTSVKFAAGTIGGGVPSDATVRAATADSSSPFEAASLVTLAPGESVIVAAYAYDAQGNESVKGTRTVQRDGASVTDILQLDDGTLMRLADDRFLYRR
jgi:hypothetical protein